MGYGGTAHSTVSVDIVQADVDAIIDGLTGGDGRNLSDLNAHLAGMFDLLAGYSYSPLHNGTWAVDYLANIQSGTNNAVDLLSGSYYGPLVDTAEASSVIADCLTGNESGPLHDGDTSAVEWLDYIESDTYELVGMLGGWTPSVLSTPYTSAIDYLDWIAVDASGIVDFLGGWSSGPLTDTADNLYSWSSGQSAADLLDDIRNDQSDYLYDWYSGQSAVELLRDLRDGNDWYFYDTYSGMTAIEYLRDITEIANLLYDANTGQSTAGLLGDIRETLWQFTFDWDGRLRVTID